MLALILSFLLMSSSAYAEDVVQQLNRELPTTLDGFDPVILKSLSDQEWKAYPDTPDARRLEQKLMDLALAPIAPHKATTKCRTRLYAIHALNVRGKWDSSLEDMAVSMIEIPYGTGSFPGPTGARNADRFGLVADLRANIPLDLRNLKRLIARLQIGDRRVRLDLMELVHEQILRDAMSGEMFRASSAVREQISLALDDLDFQISRSEGVRAVVSHTERHQQKIRAQRLRSQFNLTATVSSPDTALSILRATRLAGQVRDPRLASALEVLATSPVLLGPDNRKVLRLAEGVPGFDTEVQQAAQSLVTVQAVLFLQHRVGIEPFGNLQPCLKAILFSQIVGDDDEVAGGADDDE